VGVFLVQEVEGVGLASQYLLGHRILLHFRRETLIWLVRELLVRLCLVLRTLLGHRMWLHFVSANQ
jgi:hypothetical protein